MVINNLLIKNWVFDKFNIERNLIDILNRTKSWKTKTKYVALLLRCFEMFFCTLCFISKIV